MDIHLQITVLHMKTVSKNVSVCVREAVLTICSFWERRSGVKRVVSYPGLTKLHSSIYVYLYGAPTNRLLRLELSIV